MLTFFSEPTLKQAVRARVAEHRRLDRITQGVYWAPDEDGEYRGCFIGCSLHSKDHADFERLLGLPEWLAHLGEAIFEGMAPERAVDFPLALYDAIPVGADLERAKLRFIEWLILDPEHGAARLNDDPRVRAVGEGARAALRGEAVDWVALRAAAEAAARPAARPAAWAAARPAARPAAWAAAEAAAWAAAGAAAEAAARPAAWAAAEAAAGAAAEAAVRPAVGAAVGGADWFAFYLAASEALIRCVSECESEQSAPALPSDPEFTLYYEQVMTEAGRGA